MVQFSLIGTAHAQATPAAGAAGFDLLGFVPFVLILVVMYFLLIRPQQKKMKLHTDMVASLRRGDKVVTSGGIIGSIYKVTSNEEVMVEIAENIRVRVLKTAVTQVLAKTEPLSTHATEDEIMTVPEDMNHDLTSKEKRSGQGPKKIVKSTIRPKKITPKN